jgi:hypothetical protein
MANILLAFLLFLPSIDATLTHRSPTDYCTIRTPESFTFDAKGQGTYNGVSDDGLVLKWNGDKLSWMSYSYGPDYSSEACTVTVSYIYRMRLVACKQFK